LWHIYPFYILVDRAGAAAVTLLTKEIPLRLLVEKKADVTMDSSGKKKSIHSLHIIYIALIVLTTSPVGWYEDGRHQ